MPDMGDGTGWVCPPGHYCEEGTLNPTPCSNGTYNPFERGINVSNCLECDPGKFCSENGLLAPNGNCSSGFYCPRGNVKGDANPCPPGHFCPPESDFPDPCMPGTYQDKEAQDFCEICPAGRVCNNASGPVVFPSVLCPEGFYCPNGTEYGEQYPCPLGKSKVDFIIFNLASRELFVFKF